MLRLIFLVVLVFHLFQGSFLCAETRESTQTEYVGQAAQEGAAQTKKKVSWQKVAIIAGVFVITVVTIVLAARHNGHHK
jgi:hypothetical protein